MVEALFHVIGYSWNPPTYSPGLLVRNFETSQDPSFVPLRRGEPFTPTVVKGPYCIGYKLGPSSFIRCPNLTEVQRRKQCDVCFNFDSVNKCVRCFGRRCINPRAYDACQTQHAVYLAMFGDVVKVGTALGSRFLERLLEQGADLGAIIARAPNGLLARRIEKDISSSMGIEDKIRFNTKLKKVLFEKVDSTPIDASFVKIKQSLPNDADFFVDKIRICELNHYYRVCNIASLRTRVKTYEGLEVMGLVDGVKGEILFISSEFGGYVMNLKDLAGWVVRLHQKDSLKGGL